MFEGDTAGLTPVVNQFEDFNVRHVLADEPLWIGRDVCEAVGISKYRDALAQLDADERAPVVVDTLGGTQQMSAVTEAGVWSLMLISRSPKVKPFKRWLTHEVLPSIRKNGRYNADIALPDRKTMARWVIDAEERAELLQAKVTELTPPAQAWQSLADASGDYGVGDAAKVLKRNLSVDTGEQKLYRYMAGLKWVFKESGRWKAYQDQVNLGRLAEKVGKPFWHEGKGEWVNATPTVRITPKGLEELHRRLGGQLAIA
ncbi:phage antirepressor KilAC domain-containing protein [Mycolicibacterium septicum]|uniref:phage antirepressor KilAC domain-containing protein n=1 Tax=Mycolicibacterium septicum TaxID=98668 RepID=UPI001AF5105F|nr:phage antirepressor KilAC domain-containing protein [Mycolicibacterium septicum]QRY51839.1 phage antirepressor KilAC domain-containing protein [Mycolicibacterium septicum]